MIQSLAVEPRFRAIIAECPFADFSSIAYDRMHQQLPVPKPLLAPLIEPAFLYARLRLGVDLRNASPVAALEGNTQTPVLLTHGTADRNIPVEHSRRLHAANPAMTELWEVPGAGHVSAWAVAGDEFERRVLDWCSSH